MCKFLPESRRICRTADSSWMSGRGRGCPPCPAPAAQPLAGAGRGRARARGRARETSSEEAPRGPSWATQQTHVDPSLIRIAPAAKLCETVVSPSPNIHRPAIECSESLQQTHASPSRAGMRPASNLHGLFIDPNDPAPNPSQPLLDPHRLC